jgi:hypothetical protein
VQAEAVLRKKRANPEKELAAIIETYDQTMREKQVNCKRSTEGVLPSTRRAGLEWGIHVQLSL